MSRTGAVREAYLRGVRIGLDRLAKIVVQEAGAVIERDAIDEGTLLGSSEVESPAEFERVVKWTARHAAAVQFGSRPHRPPFKPVFDWVRRNLAVGAGGIGFKLEAGRSVTSEEVLRSVTYAVLGKIEKEGTEAVPYASFGLDAARRRYMEVMDGEVRAQLSR